MISPLYKRGNSFFDNTDLDNKGEPSIKRTILSRLKMVKLLRAYVWMTWHEKAKKDAVSGDTLRGVANRL